MHYINVHLTLALSRHILPREHDKFWKCVLGPAEKSGIWPMIVIKHHQYHNYNDNDLGWFSSRRATTCAQVVLWGTP